MSRLSGILRTESIFSKFEIQVRRGKRSIETIFHTILVFKLIWTRWQPGKKMIFVWLDKILSDWIEFDQNSFSISSLSDDTISKYDRLYQKFHWLRFVKFLRKKSRSCKVYCGGKIPICTCECNGETMLVCRNFEAMVGGSARQGMVSFRYQMRGCLGRPNQSYGHVAGSHGEAKALSVRRAVASRTRGLEICSELKRVEESLLAVIASQSTESFFFFRL